MRRCATCVISTLLRTDAFIYAVVIHSPLRQAINTRVNPEALSEITNQTGALYRRRFTT